MSSKTHGPPAYVVPATFLDYPSRQDRPYQIVGAPFDLGTTNRPGTRLGPAAIRTASRMLIDGANIGNGRDPKQLPVSDWGDLLLPLGDLAGSLAAISQQVAPMPHPIVLGGDHSMATELIRVQHGRHGPVAVVHFDAHTDTSPDNSGNLLAHGTWAYRALNEGLIAPGAMVQIGIRAPQDVAIMRWTAERAHIISALDLHLQGPLAAAQKIRAVVGRRPVYLSFDIDVLDPSCAPGTGTPEVGGLFTWQAQAVLRQLAGLRWVGMDVVEVSPPYDVAEITALAAATMVWEYLSLQEG